MRFTKKEFETSVSPVLRKKNIGRGKGSLSNLNDGISDGS